MTLAEKPKNTKYYINSAIGVSIMLFFGYLPTFSTVTPIGMVFCICGLPLTSYGPRCWASS